jgi:nuclear pore complex protein Nup188
MCIPDNTTVARHMLQVAQQCLSANQGVPGPENIFVKLVDSRANLALVLIQRLVKSPFKVQDITELLGTLIGTIRAVEEPFAPESISYYRLLLKTLFVTLRAYHISDSKADNESSANLAGLTVNVTQTILNILDRVVGRGFRLLVGLVHDNEAEVLPEDLALNTAILQACLSLPGIDQSQTQILNIMASHDVINAATSLFSWADKLVVQGDPVYGELSLLFLMELSNLPVLAEQLACDGILSSILSANLTKYMQKSTVSPFAESPFAQRCYCIWAKGLLPLMLNLLTALGATIAPEITYVLSQFSHLLEASVERFDAGGSSRISSRSAPQYITLLATSEIHSLALMVRVLGALRANNTRDIPAVDWDATTLAENIDFWLSSRRLLKERLLPLGQRELEWRNRKTGPPGDGGCDNLLEEKVVSQLETVREVLNEQLEG